MRKAKGKEIIKAQHKTIGSPVITVYSCRIQLKQPVQSEVRGGVPGKTVEHNQRVEMTTMEADLDLETTDIGSGLLGAFAVRQEMPLGKNGSEPKGTDGVSVGMRKTNEELALPGLQESICAGHGVAETENMEKQFPSGGEAGFDGEYQLVSDSSLV